MNNETSREDCLRMKIKRLLLFNLLMSEVIVFGFEVLKVGMHVCVRRNDKS